MRLKFNSLLLLIGAFAGFAPAAAFAQQVGDEPAPAPLHYNPDANGNGNIATYDLVELLALFGQDVPCPDVVPASTVEELTAQVELLEQWMQAQSQQLQLVINALQAHESVQRGPFVWSEELAMWVCEGDVLVDGVVTSAAVHTRRIESGSARIGGLQAN